MKSRQKIGCYMLLLFLTINNMMAQVGGTEKQLIRARLINEDTHTPVVYARVINKNRIIGVYSDSLGIFSIPASIRDTLYITSIGFYPKEIKVTDSLFKQVVIAEIPLMERIYEMGAVEVNPLGTYDQFKYNVLHLNLPRDATKDVIASIQRELKTIPKHPLQREASIPLGSPITMFYMMFSKEGKSLRKLKSVMEEEKILRNVNQKYNREIVARVTGLTGELLNQFMLFCTPDNLFILMSTEYDVCKRITECYVDFRKDVMKVTINQSVR